MDVSKYNSLAWDKQVEQKNEWTIPVDSATIKAARNGEWKIFLTPNIPVPRSWFPQIKSLDILCLASGGGQQGPVLAAAGAYVTVYDNSIKQLKQDQFAAHRDGLILSTVRGDMRDLSAFADQSFDLIVHPVSNVFVEDILPVWRETYRVLRRNGSLLAGFMNPAYYIFDHELLEHKGILKVKFKLPYSDIKGLSSADKKRYKAQGTPLEFSHTLTDQIAGQLQAGFVITGFYEDRFADKDNNILSKYMPTFLVTRSQKI